MAASLRKFRAPSAADWDTVYREGLPPWEMGIPSPALEEFLKRELIRKGSVLELGCGTGADAVLLAQKKFDVTAIDFAPTAIERARTRAQRAGARLCLVLEDVFLYNYKGATFDLVYDCGFYQYVRLWELSRLLDLLWRVTKPGSYYLSVSYCGTEEFPGLTSVTEDNIRWELGRLFELKELSTFRFYSPLQRKEIDGISALLYRPEPKRADKQ